MITSQAEIILELGLEKLNLAFLKVHGVLVNSQPKLNYTRALENAWLLTSSFFPPK